jgi:hypothetical protein
VVSVIGSVIRAVAAVLSTALWALAVLGGVGVLSTAGVAVTREAGRRPPKVPMATTTLGRTFDTPDGGRRYVGLGRHGYQPKAGRRSQPPVVRGEPRDAGGQPARGSELAAP